MRPRLALKACLVVAVGGTGPRWDGVVGLSSLSALPHSGTAVFLYEVEADTKHRLTMCLYYTYFPPFLVVWTATAREV